MWDRVHLADLTHEITVGYVGSMAHEYKETGVPFLRSLNITPYRVLLEDVKFISDEFHQQLSKSRLGPDDVVVVRTGNTGTAAVIPPWLGEANCSDLVIIRPNELLNSKYLVYYINSRLGQHAIGARNVGSVQLHFNVGSAKSLPIPLPPLDEQERIVHVLGTLDDKIEINRQMNETLEAMARAIFKSWFVDFDPVHAKANGEQPIGMDAETAAIFPDSFEPSELGDIPRGWSVGTIGDHVKAAKGLSYKGKFLEDSIEYGLPMHNLNSVNEWGTYKFDGIKFYSGEYQPRHEVNPGDLIVANTEQGFDRLLIASPAIVPAVFGDEGIISHHLYKVKIKPNSPVTRFFLYYRIMLSPFRDLIQGYTNGTTVNMLPPDAFKTPQFVMPSRELMQLFDDIVAPMLQQIEHNFEESQTLENVRDTLLPKLISGEIRVPEAEEMIEDIE